MCCVAWFCGWVGLGWWVLAGVVSGCGLLTCIYVHDHTKTLTGWIESLSAGTSLRTADLEVRAACFVPRLTASLITTHRAQGQTNPKYTPTNTQHSPTHRQVFKLSLSLTQAGLQHVDEIVGLVHQYLKLLRTREVRVVVYVGLCLVWSSVCICTTRLDKSY